MKRTHLIPIVFCMAMFVSNVTHAQYRNIRPFAVGLRGCPDGGGVTGRVFVNDFLAIEGQLNYSGGNPNGSGKSTMGVVMLEYNTVIAGPDMSLFLGVGAHYGKWERHRDISVAVPMSGLDLMVGLEYSFPTIPLGLSVDIKPAFNYVSGITFFPNNMFGLGVKYYFGHWETRSEIRRY